MVSQKKYEVEVKENTARSSPVAMVRAEDADKGDFGSVTYSLAGPLARDFQIDSSGTITVVNSALLDRETSPSLTVYATATDGVHSVSVPVRVFHFFFSVFLFFIFFHSFFLFFFCKKEKEQLENTDFL